MFGRRPDGRRLNDVDPIVQITPYLMPMRCDAQVFLEHKMDYEKAARYIAEKNRRKPWTTRRSRILKRFPQRQ